jgi:hypothetical protein
VNEDDYHTSEVLSGYLGRSAWNDENPSAGFPEKSSPLQPIVMMPGRNCACRGTNTEKEL